MSAARQSTYRRLMTTAVALVGAGALVTGCTSNEPASSGSSGNDTANAASSNDESGDTVTIGFSAPAADHGWMGSITKSAVAEAEALGDVDLVVAEGTNDVNLQISQVETFINDKVDAIVLLPFDGAAMTDVATKAMNAAPSADDPGSARNQGGASCGCVLMNLAHALASPRATA